MLHHLGVKGDLLAIQLASVTIVGTRRRIAILVIKIAHDIDRGTGQGTGHQAVLAKDAEDRPTFKTMTSEPLRRTWTQ